ncbi:MAG: hypothetical protein ACTSUE_08985, partial [Promethearchaeota archaeon]
LFQVGMDDGKEKAGQKQNNTGNEKRNRKTKNVVASSGTLSAQKKGGAASSNPPNPNPKNQNPDMLLSLQKLSHKKLPALVSNHVQAKKNVRARKREYDKQFIPLKSKRKRKREARRTRKQNTRGVGKNQ